MIRIVGDGVAVAGTEALPNALATTEHLTVDVEALPLIRHLAIVLPLIDLDTPIVNAISRADGSNNWTLDKGSSSSASKSSGSGPLLGILRIENGQVHVADAKLRAKFDIQVVTRNTPNPSNRPITSDQGQIVGMARGTYAGQPITGRFVGGAILSLRDKSRPYPVDLQVANRPTYVSLVGTIEQPLTFGGARLKLTFAGPDMSLLYALTAVPIPRTTPYSVIGMLFSTKQRTVFRNFEGRVGSSDLNGTIAVVPGAVPNVDATLVSHRVDLADLGGFIGASPGSGTTPKAGQAPASTKAPSSSGDVLPTTKVNMPKVRAASVELSYKGDHIENRSVPLDNVVARLDIQGGVINLKQLDFAVGSGTIFSRAMLDPSGDTLRTRVHVYFHKIDLSRVMQATHAFHGEGILAGQADLITRGNSVAEMLSNGDGGLTLVMQGGGNISALLPDVAGLELGNAILSALGLPDRAEVQCFVADLPLKDGILSTTAFLLQTSEARSAGQGTVDFRNQTLDYQLTTRSSHFSVGSLPGAIHIMGKLGKPAIMPGAEVVARAGVAAGLGVVLPPLALLPTIQFGVGEHGACQAAPTDVATRPAAPPAKQPPARGGRPVRSHRHAAQN